MQRTQIYFEQHTLKDLKEIASALNISVSEFIRTVMTKEIKQQKENDIYDYIQHMKPVESFADIDAGVYVQNLRGKSRILHD